jgi:hypothetical protein
VFWDEAWLSILTLPEIKPEVEPEIKPEVEPEVELEAGPDRAIERETMIGQGCGPFTGPLHRSIGRPSAKICCLLALVLRLSAYPRKTIVKGIGPISGPVTFRLKFLAVIFRMIF